jgi:hypothetical protein
MAINIKVLDLHQYNIEFIMLSKHHFKVGENSISVKLRVKILALLFDSFTNV